MDAWAELRVFCQLCKEGFSSISKVTETADLTATRGDGKFAFQVKRINNSLDNQVNRRNKPDMRDSNPTGEIGDIYARLDGPLSYFFWDSLEKKNGIGDVISALRELPEHICFVVWIIINEGWFI